MNSANFVISKECEEVDSLKKILNYSTWTDINLDEVKQKVQIRYVNFNLIEYKYKDAVYKKFLDLAKTVHILSFDKGRKPSSYILTKSDIQFLNISEEEIFKYAEDNTKFDTKIRILEFKDYLNRLNNPFFAISRTNPSAKIAFQSNSGDLNYIEDNKVLVVSTIDNLFGSSYCFLPNVLKDVQSILKDSFYIVPLSFHQVLFISKNYLTNDDRKQVYEAEQDLFYMINDINDDLSWKNILTYNSYYYDKSVGNIMVIKNKYA